MMKKLLSLMLAFMFAFSMVACSASDAPSNDGNQKSEANQSSAKIDDISTEDVTNETAKEEDKFGGVLRLAIASDVLNSFPAYIRMTTERAQLYFLYEGLTKINEDGNWSPFLAESLVGDAEKMTYTIKLKEGITFSDGSPLDAETCLWNMQYFKDNSPSSGTYYGSVESMEAVDDLTVVVHMSSWDSMFPYNMSLQAGFMYSKAAFDKNGEEWAKVNPVGTGPFVLTEWKKDDTKTFVRNENYWGGDVYLDGVEVKIIADDLTAQAAMLTGDIDIYIGATSTSALTLMDQGYSVLNDPTMYTAMLMVFGSECEGSPLCELAVRQAICYAIDSDAINNSVMDGLGCVSNQFALPGTAFYSPYVVGYEYNPEKAKELLKEAGYENGFETTIYTNGMLTTASNYLTLVQAYLADIGIKLNIEIQESALYSSTSIYGVEEGMIFHGCSMPAGLVTQFVSNLSKRAIGGIGMLNSCMMHPDDLDEVIMNSLASASDEEAAKLMQEAQVMNFDKYCQWYPVLLAPTLTVLNANVMDSGWNCGSRDASKTWIAK